MADEVWLDVLPSMRGFGADLIRQATGAARTAGGRAGEQYGQAFESGSDGAAEAAVRELETAQKRSAGLIQKLTGDISKARQAQQKSAADVLVAEQRLADAAQKYGDNSRQAQAATLRLEAARSKASDATDRFKSVEESLRGEQRTQTTVTEQLTAAQQELTTEVERSPGAWSKFTDAMGTAGGKVKSFSEGAGGMVSKLAGAVGGAALLTEAFSNNMENETVVDKLNASLASTPTQAATYGAATGNLYANAYGESMSDVGLAVDSVVSSMAGMRDASSQDIERITGHAMNLAQAFDVDVTDAATTAGTLMKNGLAKDADTAMDLIAGSMSKIPAGVRGEILPIMDEYSKHFAALGIDGETAMGIIVSASQDGEIGMDKMGDALKEFTIRGTDMSKGTSDAYKAMGLSTKEMTNDLLAGGDKAEGAMAKIVGGLQNIKDPGEQAAAAISLFGTPLEDLGTNKIPDFLGMIDPMGDAFASTEGAADQLSATLGDSTANSLETLKRAFSGMVSDGIAPAMEPLSGVMTWAAKTPGVMTAVSVALGIMAVAWAAVTLAASPWLAIGVGIAAVIGVVVLAVMNWGSIMNWFGGIFGGAVNGIKDAWGGMVNGIVGWWNDTLNPMFGRVGLVVTSLYKTYVKPAVDGIKNGWGNMVGGIVGWWNNTLKPTWAFIGLAAGLLWSTYVKPAVDGIKGGWSNMVGGIKKVWDTVLKPVFDTFASVIKGDLPGAFESGKKAINGIWNQIKGIAAKPINFVIETVYNNGLRKAINKVTGIVGGKELPALGGIPGYAKGGLHQGGWAMVGEEGPELVDFGSPGRVYTAKDTREMMAGQQQTPAGALDLMSGASNGMPRLPIGGFGSALADGAGWLGGKVSDAWNAGTDWVRGGLAKAAELILNPIKDGIGAVMPDNTWGDIGRNSVNSSVNNALTWIRGKDEQFPGEGGPEFTGTRGGFARPSRGPITSKFGPRWGSYHAGVDIAGGGPTYAAWGGKVVRTGANVLPGRTGQGIVISHGDSMWTYYGHNPLGGIRVKPGQEVKAGQRIGAQGATGNVTGIHLHWEKHLGKLGRAVNPIGHLYDQGGVLPPGVSTVVNKTRKPETIYTNAQDKALKTLASRGAAGSGMFPDKLTLVVDGHEFTAFVRATADDQVGQRVSGLRQVERQMAGL